MNMPRPRIQEYVDQVDDAAADRQVTTAPLTPPAYGQPQNDAINSVFDGIVQDLSRKLGELRARLDEIEQLMLTGAAKAKVALQEQISLCVRIDDEINHAAKVIAELREQAGQIDR